MKSAATLPIVLKNPKILLIGAGKVGYEKAKVLFENNIDFSNNDNNNTETFTFQGKQCSKAGTISSWRCGGTSWQVARICTFNRKNE